MANRDIIVIGGSSGATGPLKTILGALPPDLPAAVFVVLHIPVRSLGLLATVAAAAASMPVKTVTDGLAIEPGNIYIGVPDHHLIVREGHVQLGRGPRENMARPAIDPLFRSAAMAYGPRVISVLLSGLLNDGTSGLEAVKRCGGMTVVQDPADAMADEMPRSAIEAVEVDMVAPSIRLGDILAELAQQPAGPGAPASPDIRLEVDIAAGERIDSSVLRQIADPAALTCPGCGGALSSIRGSQHLRFRCQVGHAFSAETLASHQENTLDEALRIALRVIGERAELVARMAADARRSGHRAVSEMYDERATEYRHYAEVIRRAVLMSMPALGPSGDEGSQV